MHDPRHGAARDAHRLLSAPCAAVQARSSSTGRALRMASAATPLRNARSAPLRSHASWPGAWASESIVKRQPASTASRMSRFGGSCRSGRLLISIALSKRAAAANTISASNVDSGRFRRPARIRPVMWPRTSRCGLASAATIRRVIGRDSIRSSEWTLPTTRSRRSRSSGSWSSSPSARMSTSIPVRMRNGASASFSRATSASCWRRRSGESPFATVRRGEWSVRTM